MDTLLDDCRSLLEVAGYATRASRPDVPVAYFEDDVLLGFVCVFTSAQAVLEGWLAEQDSFLKQNAPSLLRAPVKAWNIYAVFLSRAQPSVLEERQLLAIEEDFRSTRKIARGGVRTREELAVVLGPLLPIEVRVSLTQGDARNRLRDRLGPSGSAASLLLSGAKPEEIAKLLLEES